MECCFRIFSEWNEFTPIIVLLYCNSPVPLYDLSERVRSLRKLVSYFQTFMKAIRTLVDV